MDYALAVVVQYLPVLDRTCNTSCSDEDLHLAFNLCDTLEYG